jgi:hypothetical protein
VNTHAELDVGREEVDTLVLVEGALDECRGDDVLLAVETTEERVGELGTSVRHREGGGSGTVLSLDDLVTAVLDALDDSFVRSLVLNDALASIEVAQEGDDGGAGVATNNRDDRLGRVGVGNRADETGGTDNVEGGDTEKTLGVEDTGLLKGSSDDGYGRVDRVGDDEDVRIRGNAGNSGGEVADDGRVSVEEVVTGHAGL